MIYLTKGQSLFNNEGMVVCGPTGYYEDGATVLCAMFHSPDEPVYSYEAKYISYGDQVYNISDESKLLEEIKKIDPESLLGKTNVDVTVDNLVQEIKTVDNPTPELTQDAVDTNNTNIDNQDITNRDNNITDSTTDNTTVETTYDENTDTTTTTTTTTLPEDNTITTDTVIPDTTIIDSSTTDTVIPDTTIIDSSTTDTVIPDIIIPDLSNTDQPVSILTGRNKRKLI